MKTMLEAPTAADVCTAIPRHKIIETAKRVPDLLERLQRRLENAKSGAQWLDAYETLTLCKRVLEEEKARHETA